MAGCHPADIADIIDKSPTGTHERLFSLLPEAMKPAVLAELATLSGSDVLESLSNPEVSQIVEEMAPDDAADIIAVLPDDRSEKILSLMEKQESEEVRRLLKYEDDTAGGIMTTDVVAMRENQTVEEALQAIAYLDTRERFFNANIVDDNNVLIGYVDIWELLRERDRTNNLGRLVHRDFIAAKVNMDQEEVARLMNKYDLTVIPVVDVASRLVGRVTADDVIDVMEEEASEDIFRLAGSDDSELEHVSTLRSCLVRLPWLLVTLFGGFLTSLILRHFHAHISEILVLGVFVPSVLAMGGNTGIQSSTLLVRSIALGTFESRDLWRLLMHEVSVGLVMGCICGLIIGVFARFLILVTTDSVAVLALSPNHLASIVGLALLSAMTFATVFGATVPIALNKMRIDPAVASGPFITIANDISALLIYFGVTVLMLHKAF
jgi:magnesium transporter